MSDLGGAGIGAGGGAVAATVAYLLDRFFGSGRSLKTMEEKLDAVRGMVDRAVVVVEKLQDWHNIPDPDDPAGKIWYFSVALRRILEKMQAGINKLLELLAELIQRFDRYNQTMASLITVVEKLQRDVSALGILVSGMDRR